MLNQRDFLIPANTKRSMLIFSVFTTMDLIIFLVGIGITMILLMALNLESIVMAIIALSPGLIAAFLVMPIPNYHNVRTILKNIIIFYSSRQHYVWKGWCFLNGEENQEQIY